MSAVLQPTSLADALSALAADPDVTVLAGGTDLMVEVNYGRRRPEHVLSLRRVAELRDWRVEGTDLWLGARLTYADLTGGELAERLPALAHAARTVGSPQIRRTGTIGGNLATASPAGDTLPVLAAYDAQVELSSAGGTTRLLPIEAFITGPKRTDLRPDELITGVRFRSPNGPQEFLKVGTRNAMVISVASCALVADPDRRELRCALGSVGPTPIRCPEGEAFAADRIDWDTMTIAEPGISEAFGERCATAAQPITDHRSTAAYRRHAVGVLARRALQRAVRSPGDGDR